MKSIPEVRKALREELDFLVKVQNDNMKDKPKNKVYTAYVSGAIYGTEEALRLLQRERDKR